MITQALKQAPNEVFPEVAPYADSALSGVPYHATQEPALLAVKNLNVAGSFADIGVVGNPADSAMLRERAIELCIQIREGTRAPSIHAPLERLRKAMALAVGEEVAQKVPGQRGDSTFGFRHPVCGLR